MLDWLCNSFFIFIYEFVVCDYMYFGDMVGCRVVLFNIE